MSLRSRFTNLFRAGRVDSELDAEIQFHLEERIEQLVAGGMNRHEAERDSRRKFGNRLLLRETSHDVKVSRWLESIVQDIRFGCRMLWKDRAATGAAALSLALALGACATAFLLIDSLLLRPLRVSHADRLFYLAWPDREMRTPPGMPQEHTGFSYPLFQHLRSAAGATLDLFGSNWPVPLNPVVFDLASGERELVRIAAFSGNGFSLLGIRPAAGRLFVEADDTVSAASPVAVISHAFWKRRFGADPSVVGRPIMMGDRQFQIVGIVEKSFTGLQPGYLNDVWIPLTAMFDTKTLASPNTAYIGVWGRVNPDNPAAQHALQAAFTNFRRDQAPQMLPPGASADQVAAFVNAPLLFHAAPAGGDSIFRLQFSRPLFIFGIFSGLLLLIAASNVANLFIARAVAREREMALRTAIGAGRSRLVRQLLIESALLATLACAGAIAIGAVAAPFFANRLGATSQPSYLDVQPDWRLSTFMAIAGLLTTLLFGVIPALRASAVRPDEALKTSARQSRGIGALRPLLTIQVAFSFMVLFLSGLLLLSFNKLIHVDLGFVKDHVILFTINTRGLSPEQQRRAAIQLLDRTRRIDGVLGASLSQQGPMGGTVLAFVVTPFIRFPGRAPETLRPFNVPVSPGFFETMQIRLLNGREFETRDVEASTGPAVIVNEAFSQRFFPGENPLGKRFELIGDGEPVSQEVVGVVANSRFHDLREPIAPTIYSPVRNLNGATLEVRTAANPLALASILRRAIEGGDPALRIRSSILQSARIDDTLIGERLLAWLGGFFGIASIALVAVGLHGVISYSVTRRTREIGIRMALGAEQSAVVRLIVADLAALICVGILLGAAGGVALAQFLAALLFEVQTTGFQSLAAPLMCLLAACVVAALRPALRAARVDPVVALRYD